MLNIVVPMAGAGSRFAKAGYLDPKPLIPVRGVPMIEVVIHNLKPSCEHRFIFVCQRSHIERYRLIQRLSAWAPGCEIIGLDGVTQGAACTVLAAREHIREKDALMIANSDQYVDIDMNDYLAEMERGNLDGLIMTMTADDPKWSFVGLSDENLVTNVAEKQVISDEATVGIYNFRRGGDFLRAADAMIRKELLVNSEYYVAPVYNEMIAESARIGISNVGREGAGMYGLGIPNDLERFLTLPVCERATGVPA
ncbi:glycosyltransferase family 2 protein [Paraburkholderia sp.]|uniref:glycosyltransferase family 2 protein n=1 Tax=Paraburkholderia sp. TaxID=1926495 RepID=UPI0025F45AE3|nr:glycosyltransferase family 2 protein [Paraburkholderia sp.]